MVEATVQVVPRASSLRRVDSRNHLIGSDESLSVYSRNTTGTPLGGRGTRSSEEHGTAYIVDTKPMVHKYQNIVSRAKDRSASGKSTGSWKGWMASEMSKLAANEETERQLQAPTWKYKGFGHVREEAQADQEDTSIGGRKTSGAKQMFDFARKLSGKYAGKRNGSGQLSSAESTECQPPAAVADKASQELTPPRVSKRRHGFARALNTQSNENQRPATALSVRTVGPGQGLSSIEESPLTPFSKFMATDNSPPLESPLFSRPATSMNTRRSPEREMRLRRMQSSLPSSGRGGKQQSCQYPWLQQYRDSPGLWERPSLNVRRGAQLPEDAGKEEGMPKPWSRTNRTVELFLHSRQLEGRENSPPAFI